MKKIKRRPLAKRVPPLWDVRFRPCQTGIAIDITLVTQFMPGSIMVTAHRSCYLVPWEQIDAWSKAPRGKLVSIKTPKPKRSKKKGS